MQKNTLHTRHAYLSRISHWTGFFVVAIALVFRLQTPAEPAVLGSFLEGRVAANAEAADANGVINNDGVTPVVREDRLIFDSFEPLRLDLEALSEESGKTVRCWATATASWEGSNQGRFVYDLGYVSQDAVAALARTFTRWVYSFRAERDGHFKLDFTASSGDFAHFVFQLTEDGVSKRFLRPRELGFVSGTVVDTIIAGRIYEVSIVSSVGAVGTLNTRSGFQSAQFDWLINEAPVAIANSPLLDHCSSEAGSLVRLDASLSYDSNNDPLEFTWIAPPGVALDDPHSVAPSGVFPPGISVLTLTVEDSWGAKDTINVQVALLDQTPPSVDPIQGPSAPVGIGTLIETSAKISDNCAIQKTTWDWGDGSTSAGGPLESNPADPVRGTHAYTRAGVYTVRLIVNDEAGNSTQGIFQFIVVYDPDGGFVTGGGWIDSPLAAYTANPNLTGKATFGFVSKYLPGANVPSGNTEFQFKAGNLNFKSTVYDWLVVAGSKAQFKGTGTINGAGGYKFLLMARDGQAPGGGGVDKFRLKITEPGGGVVYDNVPGGSDDMDSANPQAISGGSIVIHKE